MSRRKAGHGLHGHTISAMLRRLWTGGQEGVQVGHMRLNITFDAGTLLVREGAAASTNDGAWVESLPEVFRFDHRVDAFRAPGNSYRALLTALVHKKLPFDDQARDYEKLALDHRSTKQPYEHQREALQVWRAAGGRGVVVLPTGAGKSFLAYMALATVSRAALVVVPTIDLMHQWYTGLEAAFGGEIGLLGGGYHEPRDITVSTYDSAYIHMERLGNRFGLVIFDEVHHLPSPSYAFAAACCIAPYRLGLTATPERSDEGEHAYDDLVGPILYRKRIKELTGIHLSEYDVEHVEVELDDDERARYQQARELYLGFVRARRIRMGGADGWRRFLQETSRSADGRRAHAAYREQRAIALGCRAKTETLEQLLEAHRVDRVLIFTNDNASVFAISKRFLIPSITHQTPVKERKEVLERFNAGRYPALVTSRVLNEGVDIPEANVGIVLSGTGSVREHVQRLGRILRRQEGKRAVLYEIVARGTNEEFVSQRRRDHEAYDG